ncbi:MAG: YidC/Oxa1 family membrane protein insertase [Oscillospiraceae bacterium]|jgi:YidC/Oxa1 family membrane protein insertase|nr:YidC/Oxa1 family membrane protein insertase [Oscillospiraceae bacterium]
MFEFMNFFSGFFGYALGYFFDLFGNYGVSVILFTALVSLLTIPLMIRRHRNMTPSVRFEIKREELQKSCGKDAQKFQHEFLVLSQKEGFNPMKGCFNITTFLTFIIFGGIYSTIQSPLTNVLHLPNSKVKFASEVISAKSTRVNTQLEIVKNFEVFKEKLTMFSPQELEKISKLSSGFSFLGLNLLKIPKFSKFSDKIWIIPLLSLIVSLFSTQLLQKISGMAIESDTKNRIMMMIFPIFQAWITYTVFAAVGLYLITSGIFGVLQSLLIDKFFSIYALNAKKESNRFKQLLSTEAE